MLRVLVVNFGICFNTYFFPLKTSELADGLEKRGYEISPRIPFPRPPVAVSGAGTIARKGKTVIHVDSRGQVLTVADVSIKSALDTYKEITAMLKEEYQIDLENLIGTYEFNVQCEAPTEKQAYETLAKNVEIPILNQIEQILKKKVCAIELRFGGANMIVNSPNWFDISIEPNFTRNDSYLINASYRTEKKEESIVFLESFEENLNRIMEVIDK